MTVLTDLDRLAQEASVLSIAQLEVSIATLNTALQGLKAKDAVLADMERLAASQGYTLSRLGFKKDVSVKHAATTDKSLRKPRLYSVNPENQLFFVYPSEPGKLLHLRSHAQKKSLVKGGAVFFGYSDLDVKQRAHADKLIQKARADLIHLYNVRVDEWNAKVTCETQRIEKISTR